MRDSDDAVSTTKKNDDQKLDGKTFAAYDVLYSAIKEGKMATLAHIETIRMVLLLLDALDGFSPTVDVLKQDVQESMLSCEETLKRVGKFEETIE